MGEKKQTKQKRRGRRIIDAQIENVYEKKKKKKKKKKKPKEDKEEE